MTGVLREVGGGGREEREREREREREGGEREKEVPLDSWSNNSCPKDSPGNTLQEDHLAAAASHCPALGRLASAGCWTCAVRVAQALRGHGSNGPRCREVEVAAAAAGCESSPLGCWGTAPCLRADRWNTGGPEERQQIYQGQNTVLSITKNGENRLIL